MPPTTFDEAQDVLAAQLPGYTRRAHQMALAEQVEAAIDGGRPALLQAGTGTGKSFALMIPAVLSGKRTVVATYNKALQNQYVGDLEFLAEHLGVPFRYAVLKGRANYPCYARKEEVTSPTAGQKEILARMDQLAAPDAIRELEVTDREDFTVTDEEWRPFSMSSAECPGSKACPFADKCLAERAKARAEQSQIVVTNTAYLLQDIKLRLSTDGNVALLGEVEQAILDEAHTLPDVATSALEDTMGQGTFAKMSRDVASYLNDAGYDDEAAFGIERAAVTLWEQLELRHSDFRLKAQSKTDPMPLSVKELIEDLGPYFIALYQAIDGSRGELKRTPVPADKRAYAARQRLLSRTANQMARITDYTTDPAEKTVRWAEVEQSMFRGQRRERLFLRSAPVSVAPFLRAALWDAVPAILSSATLAAGKDFGYLCETLGLGRDEAITFDAGTPFDYPRQAVLFTPAKGNPEPTGKTVPAWRAWTQTVTSHLVTEAGGGALLLFTSRSAMEESYKALAPQFTRAGLTVMKQGDAPNPVLIREFKADGNAVLFALRTFFEGVDIQGRALRLVVLDKLPFAVPSDLVLQARAELIERKYNDKWASFRMLTIPSMILILSQGFGRLIRHAEDRGVVAILDPRLNSKGYGRQILGALPPARRTSDIKEAARFLKAVG